MQEETLSKKSAFPTVTGIWDELRFLQAPSCEQNGVST